MENNTNIFSSKITRSQNELRNDLYALLPKVPVEPVKQYTVQNDEFVFRHKTDKQYIPQKKSQLKVQTVEEIRKKFEQDIYTYLTNDIENQQNILLQKIREGSSGDASTRELANNILNIDKPVSRPTWQMLKNINAEQHTFNKQFVIWNNQYIQVNGSKGGENKILSKYDLSNNFLHKKNLKRRGSLNKRYSLLKKSLYVKFKPGPLRYKKYLDESHQKYHVGETELVSLPKVCLDIYPSYGKTLENNVIGCINNLRSASGVISKKWAEFAVTMIGKVNKSTVTQTDPNDCVSFDLAYKHNQKKIIMRCGMNIARIDDLQDDNKTLKYYRNKRVNITDIERIVEEMLESVEISLKQDHFYIDKEEPRFTTQDYSINTINCKTKRKFCELDRLDVKVIQLPSKYSKNEVKNCGKEFCEMGCVCTSLECPYYLKNHCGRIECIFQCKCDYSLQNQLFDQESSSFNFDIENNLSLANEEKKFHQTVVVSGKKRFFLNAQKRNWKTPTKYADFYKNVNLKTLVENKQIPTIVVHKLENVNIVPWCMTHELYKCFCKGKFKYSYTNNINDSLNGSKVMMVDDVISNSDFISEENKNTDVHVLSKRDRRRNSDKLSQSYKIDACYIVDDVDYSSCARIDPYKDRNYSNAYYRLTHAKILEMERNDKTLRQRLNKILKYAEVMKDYEVIKSSTEEEYEVSDDTTKKNDSTINNVMGLELNHANLAAWLEVSYKSYKKRIERGNLILNAPKRGTLELYPWDFILKRYIDKKNIFLVTKQKPWRIFMTITMDEKLLVDCILIDDIQTSDLNKYSLTVRNLINKVSNIENIFYILHGLFSCWELIGSVTKLNQSPNTKIIGDFPYVNPTLPESSQQSKKKALTSKSQCEVMSDNNMKKSRKRKLSLNTSQTSKWFVMNIENDFEEIQFYNKGFFVKYLSIITAIRVARKTGKTVRLSTHNTKTKPSSPHFGIYAIPDSNGCFVVVGPYEVNESLGIEIVRTESNAKEEKKTRGVWITTNKLDDMKVINNPLSFMPTDNIEYNVPIDMFSSSNVASNCSNPENKNNETKNTTAVTKTIKPITIRKTNGFYHLAPNGMLKKISAQNSNDEEPSMKINVASTNAVVLLDSSYTKTESLDVQNVDKESNILTSDANTTMDTINKYSKGKVGMSILKPEEINKRILSANLTTNNQDEADENKNIDIEDAYNNTMETDIEEFISSSIIYAENEEDTVLISDDSEVDSDDDFTCNIRERNVWIQCNNIDDLGWIKGKKNVNNSLSFEFPGFKTSEFYPEQEAFHKINQVLSRKVFIPRNLILKWEVIDSFNKLANKTMLDEKILNCNFALTKDGLYRIVKSGNKRSLLKVSKRERISSDSGDDIQEVTMEDTNEASSSFTLIDDHSEHLENDGFALLHRAVANKSNIVTSLNTVTDTIKQEMTDTLQNIKKMAED